MPIKFVKVINEYWQIGSLLILLIIFGARTEFRIQNLEKQKQTDIILRLEHIEEVVTPEGLKEYGQFQQSVTRNGDDIIRLQNAVNNLYVRASQ